MGIHLLPDFSDLPRLPCELSYPRVDVGTCSEVKLGVCDVALPSEAAGTCRVSAVLCLEEGIGTEATADFDMLG